MSQSAALIISDMSQKIEEVRKAYKRHLEHADLESPVVIVNNSGGKDSGATDALANVITDGNYRSVAADTGNEHPLTIEHIKTLHHQRGGLPVEIVSADYPQEMFDKRKERVIKDWSGKQRIKAGAYRGIVMPSLTRTDTKFAENWRSAAAKIGLPEFESPIEAFNSSFVRSGNPFLDMCLLHGGFPIGRQRYCTDELKIQVVFDKVLSPLLDDGKDVIQWSGVRAEESDKRASYPRFSEDKRNNAGQLFNFLPIHQWTAADVFALYKYFGIKPNPLYLQGMNRVGCMPCILVNKEELAEIAARFPSEIERVAQWEKRVAMVSKWFHWMIVGHVNRRQFKPVVSKFKLKHPFENEDGVLVTHKNYSTSSKLGINSRLPTRDFVVDVEAYQGSCMLGPRGGIPGMTIYDAIDWSKTGKGGRVYDLVTASIDINVCSSKYGLCG
ncbi:phosphoadenosine phosphosulfate reductase family protein [Shewanella acanthi]|uniref:phosphoadenosine phosphosulfate reductase family protein n=1 Tax=Shewanella acanthi TaxID=2864212 RepID=UPI001C65DB0B|nr:phosphoadenosine phosphosulfate reductase family protein [Shewanella acanthi]QYJ79400.1 phosphoadenosine phosphosulfate reductase family protein [Shewanella acanthi]